MKFKNFEVVKNERITGINKKPLTSKETYKVYESEYNKLYIISNATKYYIYIREEDIKNANYLYSTVYNKNYKPYSITKKSPNAKNPIPVLSCNWHLVKPDIEVKGKIEGNRFYLDIDYLNKVNKKVFNTKNIDKEYINTCYHNIILPELQFNKGKKD
jgi:hypothetical protein